MSRRKAQLVDIGGDRLLRTFNAGRKARATAEDWDACPDFLSGNEEADHAMTDAWLHGWEVTNRAIIAEERVCRSCGCFEEFACPGGCTWAEPDLCSACVGKETPRA
jgi:hypothetical protein